MTDDKWADVVDMVVKAAAEHYTKRPLREQIDGRKRRKHSEKEEENQRGAQQNGKRSGENRGEERRDRENTREDRREEGEEKLVMMSQKTLIVSHC